MRQTPIPLKTVWGRGYCKHLGPCRSMRCERWTPRTLRNLQPNQSTRQTIERWCRSFYACILLNPLLLALLMAWELPVTFNNAAFVFPLAFLLLGDKLFGCSKFFDKSGWKVYILLFSIALQRDRHQSVNKGDGGRVRAAVSRRQCLLSCPHSILDGF